MGQPIVFLIGFSDTVSLHPARKSYVKPCNHLNVPMALYGCFGATLPVAACGRQPEYKMTPESGRTGISSGSRNARLDFSLLRNLQRIVHLDAEVVNGALQLGMAK